MNDTRNPTQDGQTDVDQKISTASSLEEDTKRRKDEGEEDLADVPGCDVSLIFLRLFPFLFFIGCVKKTATGRVVGKVTYEAVKGIVVERSRQGLVKR